MLKSHITVFVLALAAASVLFATLAKLHVLRITRRAPARWRLPILVLPLLTLCAYLTFSEGFALDTMPEDLASRVVFACDRDRISPLPFSLCRLTWWAAGQYVLARNIDRLRPRPAGEAGCGGEDSIYRALMTNRLWGLASHGVKHDSTASIFVIEDSTLGGPYALALEWANHFEEIFWGLERSTITDFVRKNSERSLLTPGPFAPIGILLPAPVLDSIRDIAMRGEDWVAFFYHRYPNAKSKVSLSRPGIAANGREAIIELGTVHDPLRGQGVLARLQCADGSWSVADAYGIWIS